MHPRQRLEERDSGASMLHASILHFEDLGRRREQP